jgi:hypothetical protein
LGKEKEILRKERGAWGNKSVKYFRIKFESYNVFYFGKEGVDLWPDRL